jgi:putative SOS response-associated peptidase YedK
MPKPQNIVMQGAKKKKTAAHDKKSKPYNFKELLRMERDPGVTNMRNIGSKHCQRWLGIEHRCVVLFTSFSEFNAAKGGHIWFAFGEERPQAVFVGIWANWTSIRKVKFNAKQC